MFDYKPQKRLGMLIWYDKELSHAGRQYIKGKW